MNKKQMEKELIKKIRSYELYDEEYLGKFTNWVKEWFSLKSFPVFLFRGNDVLCEVGCGNCIRCLIKYKMFANLEEISYYVSKETKTIFPVAVLDGFVKASKEVFLRIEEDV